MRNKDCTPVAGKRALIVANGNVDLNFLTGKRLSRYDYIIGCDGGGTHLYWAEAKANQGQTGANEDLRPPRANVDLLVGDFDSVAPWVLQEFRNAGTEIVIFPPEKDYTDLQLAVDLALEREYLELDLLGVTGSRLDHTMANLMLLFHIKEKGGRAAIIDSNNIIFAADYDTEISTAWAASIFSGTKRSASGDEKDENTGRLYVSLVVIDDCIGITLEGFKYPLHEFYAKAGVSRCISNELLGDCGRIRFRSGRMLVFISRD